MRWRLILALVALAGALLFAGVAAYLVLGTSTDRSKKNAVTSKVAKQQSTKATEKAQTATKRANKSLVLNAKLVRCLTKRDAEALRRCLSLRPGAPGQEGAPGLAGTPGRAGVSGPSGLKGKQGPPGSPGLPGAPGLPGTPSSVPGPQGDAGKEGDAGKQGASGEAGTPGAIGAPGPQGPPGADSTVPGPQGPQGPPGDPGQPGAPGAPCPNQQTINTTDGPVTVCVP